jgi:hypothetical protein
VAKHIFVPHTIVPNSTHVCPFSVYPCSYDSSPVVCITTPEACTVTINALQLTGRNTDPYTNPRQYIECAFSTDYAFLPCKYWGMVQLIRPQDVQKKSGLIRKKNSNFCCKDTLVIHHTFLHQLLHFIQQISFLSCR